MTLSKLHCRSRRADSVKTDGRKRIMAANRAQTVPWRDDPIIRERLDVVARLWATGLSTTASVAPLNQWLRERGYPEVQRTTVTDDRKRLAVLARESHPMAQEEHSEKLRHL